MLLFSAKIVWSQVLKCVRWFKIILNNEHNYQLWVVICWSTIKESEYSIAFASGFTELTIRATQPYTTLFNTSLLFTALPLHYPSIRHIKIWAILYYTITTLHCTALIYITQHHKTLTHLRTHPTYNNNLCYNTLHHTYYTKQWSTPHLICTTLAYITLNMHYTSLNHTPLHYINLYGDKIVCLQTLGHKNVIKLIFIWRDIFLFVLNTGQTLCNLWLLQLQYSVFHFLEILVMEKLQSILFQRGRQTIHDVSSS